MIDEDRIFAQSSTYARCRAFLERLAADDSPYAEAAAALLMDMDSLGIERDRGEAIKDGIIEIRGKNGKTTAWIV